MNLFPRGELPVTLTLFKNVPFDNKYENHIFRYIETHNYTDNTDYSSMSMEDFLNIPLSPTDDRNKFEHYVMTGNYNFSYGDGISVEIVLELPHNVTSANYMMVKSGNETRYYFITKTSLYSSNNLNCTCKLTLELDVIATYGAEFYREILNKPLFTERKHCQRFDIVGNIFCEEISTNEPVLQNVKPTIVENVIETTKECYQPLPEPNDNLDNLLWCYVGVAGDTRFNDEEGITKILGLSSPSITLCFPMCRNKVHIELNDGTANVREWEFSPSKWLIDNFTNAGVYGVKFSPFPPFTYSSAIYRYTGGSVYFKFYSPDYAKISEQNDLFRLFVRNKNNEVITTFQVTPNYPLCLENMYDAKFNLNEFTLENFDRRNINLTTPRLAKNEVKMEFYPFKKYSLFYRGNEGYEFHPELVACETPINNNVNITAYFTPVMNDFVISHYISLSSVGENNTRYYTKLNNGYIAKYNYTFPTGENALNTFSSSHSTSFATETITKTLASGLPLIGGIMTGNPMLVGAGAVGIGSTIAGAISKLVDLSNTPDKIGSVNSNVFHDYTIITENDDEGFNFNIMCVVEKLSTADEKVVCDYFYRFGYNCQKECYFTEDVGKDFHNRMITRKIFNYVKLNEDLRKHLTNGDIPQIVVDKLTNIFKEGITLWTMYDLGFTWQEWENYIFKDIYDNVDL